MKTKVFIDGSAGTTGLSIFERFQNRDDIELLNISSDLRKDVNERKKIINHSDVTFLCLPDDAARESVSFIENENVTVIDASTAHRTAGGWTYGFPELNPSQRKKIRESKRISVPGCHATGFVSLAYPLKSLGILDPGYPVSIVSLTGYSGGGKQRISEYEDKNRSAEFDAPREYALSQQHKHLKEMKKITGLQREPLFTPIIADYYSGMVTSLPLYTEYLKDKPAPLEIHQLMTDYYANQKFIHVMPYGIEAEYRDFIGGNICSGWDGMRIYVTGNSDRILLTSQFDNLGKGASGAAVQCFNIVTGCEEDKGLQLGVL